MWLSGDRSKLQWRVCSARGRGGANNPDGAIYLDQVTDVLARKSRKTGLVVVCIFTPTRMLNIEPLIQDTTAVAVWTDTLRGLAELPAPS